MITGLNDERQKSITKRLYHRLKTRKKLLTTIQLLTTANKGEEGAVSYIGFLFVLRGH
jgi:hypothetical protein